MAAGCPELDCLRLPRQRQPLRAGADHGGGRLAVAGIAVWLLAEGRGLEQGRRLRGVAIAVGLYAAGRALGIAFQIVGGAGHDTLIAQGFTFTPDQRTTIFATSSIETITDPSGTYTATPPTTVIEAYGSTSLVQVGNNYFLYPAGGSSGPLLNT